MIGSAHAKYVLIKMTTRSPLLLIVLCALILFVAWGYLSHKWQDAWYNDNVHLLPETTLSAVDNLRIPKIVHATYKLDSFNEIPSYVQTWFEDFRQDVPLVYTNDADNIAYLTNINEGAALRYENCQIGAHKADVWRFAKLYYEGGIYCDIKSRFVLPIYEMIDFEASKMWYTTLSINEEHSGSIYTGFIATPPGNPVMLDMLKSMIARPPPDYLSWVFEFWDIVKRSSIQNRLRVGDNPMKDGWTCHLYQESCDTCASSLDEECDKYSFKCSIHDVNGRLMLHTRDPNFGKTW